MVFQGIGADGRLYWLYLAVKPEKYAEFMHLAAERKPLHFKDYGTILDYGYDKDVPESVEEAMKEKYGCDDSYTKLGIVLAKHQ